MSLADPRTAEHARIVVHHSCKIKKGDNVLILTRPEGVPLVREIAKQVGEVGGQFLVLLTEDSVERAFLLAADDDVVAATPRHILQVIEASDVLIQIRGASNSKEMSDVPSNKMMLSARASAPFQKLLMDKRWNVTLHPTSAGAQEAGKSFESFTDFVYGALLLDWPAMARKTQVLADRMAATKKVRIVGKETDIGFSIEGRRPIIDGGEKNLPGGEVFTSPVEESVEGKVYFDKPLVWNGNAIDGVRLNFRGGLVVEHSAEKGGDLLDALLKTDEGAGRLGELGIGMNRGISDFSKDILFDEKMGDTIHMAIGMAIQEAGGKNESGIHIDMIKGMKEGGAIYFDGQPVYIDGKFSWE